MNYIALTTFGLLASLGSYAISQIPYPTANPAASLPSQIQAPADQQLLLALRAEGEQIYTCQAKPDAPGQYVWTLKAPEALLYDVAGQTVGHHYGGPSWELNDSSKVVGQIKARVDAPTANAIPWLLLEVKSHEGSGMLQLANWIQRVHTVGGKAPQTGCDAAHQNQESRAAYSADYYFYGN